MISLEIKYLTFEMPKADVLCLSLQFLMGDCGRYLPADLFVNPTIFLF